MFWSQNRRMEGCQMQFQFNSNFSQGVSECSSKSDEIFTGRQFSRNFTQQSQIHTLFMHIGDFKAQTEHICHICHTFCRFNVNLCYFAQQQLISTKHNFYGVNSTETNGKPISYRHMHTSILRNMVCLQKRKSSAEDTKKQFFRKVQ